MADLSRFIPPPRDVLKVGDKVKIIKDRDSGSATRRSGWSNTWDGPAGSYGRPRAARWSSWNVARLGSPTTSWSGPSRPQAPRQRKRRYRNSTATTWPSAQTCPRTRNSDSTTTLRPLTSTALPRTSSGSPTGEGATKSTLSEAVT